MSRRSEDRPAIPAAVERLRETIDRLDAELVELLNERSACAVEIGRLKREVGLAIHDPERERQIVERLARLCRTPLTREALARLFERILDESRRAERQSQSSGGDPGGGRG